MANSVAEILGRKKSTLIDCLAFLIGYILYGVGENVATLIVARVFLGYPLVNTVRYDAKYLPGVPFLTSFLYNMSYPCQTLKIEFEIL